MGKKKHRKQKHAAEAGKHDALAPLAGIAAALVQQANRPEARQLLASGLTMAAAAASAALTKGTVEPQPQPATSGPVPPKSPVTPVPPQAPVPPVPPQGTTRSPDPHEIGVALGKAAEQVLGAFLRKKPGV